MNEQIPGWITDAYDRLWSRSEDFTAERHGLTVLTCPPPSCFGQQIIVVRDEYVELWDFIKDAHHGKHYEGLVVTGQPGTGKSRFLRYAFARALKEHIPVAFCNRPTEYYFCDSTGCRVYPTVHLVEHDVESGKFFLALVDSNESLESPPHSFVTRSQFCYTIQATSPQPCRWHGWTEERDSAKFWVLSSWARGEVGKLQHFYEQGGPHPWKDNDGYYSPLEAFALLGPSIRQCFCEDGNRKTAQGPAHDFQTFLKPDDIFDNVDDFVAALKTETVTSPRQGLDFNRFFDVSKPYDVSNPMAHGPQFHHAISTLFLDRLLSTHFRRRTTDEQVALITRISKVRQPEVMSFVYEPTILDVLCASAGGPSTTCHLADGTAFALGPSLVLAGDEVTADTVSVVPRDNHLYLLRSGSGFPWINAFVISEGQTRVTILQTTVNFRREVVSSTVRRVIELVRRSMPNASAAIKWSFVFVSPGARGEQMAKTLRAVLFRARRHPTVVAGWLEIGALLSYPQEVLDALKHQDAEALGEVIDDDAEPGTELEEGPLGARRRTTTLLDSGRAWIDLPFGIPYVGRT